MDELQGAEDVRPQFVDVATRTDARNVVTSYQYDGLHRLVGVHYDLSQASGVSAMPDVCTSATGQLANVCFVYGTNPASNNNGRLISLTDPSGNEAYNAYDVLGRLTSMSKTVAGVNYPLTFQYNYASDLTSIGYPSGRSVAQSYDLIGRVSQIASGGVNLLTVPTSNGYNAANEILSATYGNGVAAAVTYNARLQVASLAFAKSGSNLVSLTYNYGTGNNGQIQGITDNVDNGRTVNYTYDAWSRLKTAATVGSANYPAWGLSWSYDRYGNRKQQTITAGSGVPSNSVTPSPTTNRLTDAGYGYDAAGNMTADGLNTLVYDGENQVTSNVQGGVTSTYTFDGNGLRVEKTASGSTTVYIFSGSQVIAEYAAGAAPSSPSKEYIYAGSQLLATIAGGTTSYHIADHLSARVTTDANGTVTGQQGHYPFGEDWYASNSTTKFKFTSYERDSESLNDYAMARTYVNRLGRYSSPDPLAGSTGDPQSLNRYAYTENDPMDFVDPSGLVSCTIDGMWAPCSMAAVLMDMGAASSVFLTDGFSTWMSPGFNPGAEGPSLVDCMGMSVSDSACAFLLDMQLTGGGRSSALMKGLHEILKSKDCAALLGGIKKANQILDHFLGTVDVDTQKSTGILFNSAKPLIDSGKAVAVTFTPTSGNFTNGQFTGPNFNSFVGNAFAGYSSSAQLTVEMHELIHAASSPLTNKLFVDMMRPNIPGMAKNRISNVYDINKKCGTALPPGF